MERSIHYSWLLAAILFCGDGFAAGEPWVVYPGGDGPGAGMHVVFVTGDDEYRSEESMPQMAKILSVRHGFRCSVLFAINPDTGEISPDHQTNIPGLEMLDDADLMVLFTRFRELPDEQMKHIMDYTNSGKPIIGIRTATHAFYYRLHVNSPYAKYSWNNKTFEGGYGRQVLGETWVDHYGRHNVESTRGLLAHGMNEHPLTNGVEDIWGPSDVYGISELMGDSRPVVYGVVLEGMDPDDPPNLEKALTPVAWLKSYTGDTGKTSRIFTTTMGHSYDFKSEDFRRLLVNAVYWLLGVEVPENASVDYVGEYNPSDIGFGTYKTGVKPSDYALK